MDTLLRTQDGGGLIWDPPDNEFGEHAGPYSVCVTLPEEVRYRAGNPVDMPLSFEGPEEKFWKRARNSAARLAIKELFRHTLIPEPEQLLQKELEGRWSNRRNDVSVRFIEIDAGKSVVAHMKIRLPLCKIWKDVKSDELADRNLAVANVAEKATKHLNNMMPKVSREPLEPLEAVEA
jgi:hypothetical protein